MIEFQVFDALVYMVPGIIVVSSLLLCLKSEAVNGLPIRFDSFVGAVLLGVLAFAIGFLIHLISGPIFVLLNKIFFGYSPLHAATETIVQRQDLTEIKATLESRLKVKTDDFTDLYRYATYAVISSENPLYSRIDRLQSLALMSRNLTVTIPIAVAGVCLILRLWKVRQKLFFVLLGLVPTVCGVLHIGAWQFSVATVLATYRAILIIY